MAYCKQQCDKLEILTEKIPKNGDNLTDFHVNKLTKRSADK